MPDDRSLTRVASPTIEPASREKEKDNRRVQESVNDSRFRQSGGVYNKDRSRPRFEVDKRMDVDPQRSQQYIKEIGEMGRKLSE